MTRAERNRPYAIVGMGCVFPGAHNVASYWESLLNPDVSVQRPPPSERFDWREFFSDDRNAPDKGYSALAGVVDGLTFDPKAFDLDPELAKDLYPIEHWYLMALAECLGRKPVRGRAGLYVATTSVCDPSVESVVRRELIDELSARLPAGSDAPKARKAIKRLLEEKMFARTGPGLPHERLVHPLWRDLGARLIGQQGPFFLMDAACASSFYAVDHGMRALAEGTVDTALCGGVFLWGPVGQVYFSKLSGLSARGCRPFDTEADGTVFGDGAGFVAIRRLEDALRDGDEIHSVIRGMGISSDGKGKAVYAPNSRGQVLAMQRAYEQSGIDPRTIQVVEAHATGTPVGDLTELTALTQYFGQTHAPGSLALGSVKGLFGHLGWAAAVASIIKLTLAMRNRTIPPQPGFSSPVDILKTPECSFYVPTRPTGWPVNRDALPLRASASGFGFGGTNAHLILEEYVPERWTTFVPPPLVPNRREPLAIVALGAMFPDAANAQDAMERIRTGADIASGRFAIDVAGHARRLKMMPRTVRVTDPAQLIMLQAAREAVAAVMPSEELKATCDVYIGAYGPLNQQLSGTKRIFWDWLQKTFRADCELTRATDVPAVLALWEKDVLASIPVTTEDSFPGIMGNLLPGRISNSLDLRGGNQAIDAGRASFLQAIVAAEESLRYGTSKLALAGGVSLCQHSELEALWNADPKSPGPVAEGAIVVALMTLEGAKAAGVPVLAQLDLDATSVSPKISAEAKDMLGASGSIELLRALSVLQERPSEARLIDVGGRTVRLLGRDFAMQKDAPPSRLKRFAVTRLPELGRPVSFAKPLLGTVRPWPGVVGLTSMEQRGDLLLVGDLSAFANVTMSEELSRQWLDDIEAIRRFATQATAEFRCGVLFLGAVDNRGVPHPLVGLYMGLLRSLALEQPDVRFRLLACDHADVQRGLAALAKRWDAADVDATCYEGQTWIEKLTEADERGTSSIAPQAGDVVVAFGGARGITFEVAKSLGERGCRLVLVGSSPASGSSELLARDKWLSQARKEQPSVSVRDLNHRYDTLKAIADTAANIEGLKTAGIEAIYVSADVRNPDAVANVFAMARERFGRIDGVLYGASTSGQLARLPALAAEGIATNFTVKAVGFAHVVDQLLAHKEKLPWMVVFSSISSAGADGMATYAGTNAYQNLVMERIRSVRPDAPVVAINWPAWSGAGAAARDSALMSKMEEEGRFSVINPQEGQRLLVDELARGAVAPVLYLLGTPEQGFLSHRLPASTPKVRTWPLLDEYRSSKPYELQGRRDFSVARDPWLKHHCVDGNPVVPGTFLLEMAAEAALACSPGVVVGFENIRFELFVKLFGERPASLDIRVEPLEPLLNEQRVEVTVSSDFHSASGRLLARGRKHFATIVRLADAYPPAPALTLDGYDSRQARSVPDPYHVEGTPVLLTDLFVTLRDTAATEAMTMAKTTLHEGAQGAPFQSFVIPGLLLDGTLRSAALQPANDGSLPVLAPLSFHRIDLFGAGNDVDLSRRYGSMNVRFRIDGPIEEGPGGLFEVTSPEGALLIRIDNARGYVMGRVAPTALPFYADRVSTPAEGQVVMERTLSLTRDPYLADAARFEGTSVLPGSFSLEIAAEAATLLRPDLVVSELTDIRFPKLLKLHAGREVLLRTKAQFVANSPNDATVHVTVRSAHPIEGLEDQEHATITVRFARTRPEAPIPITQGPALPDADVPAVLYHPASPLLLGGAFAVVEPVTTDGRVRVSTVRSEPALEPAISRRHILSPVHLDLVLQGVLQRRGRYVSTEVPSGIGSVRFFAAGTDVDFTMSHSPLSIRAETIPGQGGLSRAQLIGSRGVVFEVKDFTTTVMGWIDSGVLHTSSTPPTLPIASGDTLAWDRYAVQLKQEACDEDAPATALDLTPPDTVERLGERIALLPSRATVELRLQALPSLSDPLPLGAMLHTAGQALAAQNRPVRFAIEAADAESAPAMAFATAFVASLAMEQPHVDGVLRRLQGQKRTRMRFAAVPIAESPKLTLPKQPVVLLTGGARGVMAALAERLQREFGARLILLGRSQLAFETDWPEGLGPYLAQHRARFPKASVADARRDHERYLAARETLQNLIALRSQGDVQWYSCDLCDAAAVKATVALATAAFGRIDLLVHGAGVERSAPVSSKPWAASEPVIATKTTGLLNLVSAFGDALPKRCLLVSSINAVLGSDGQADYAAANAWLGEAATVLRERFNVQAGCVALPAVGDRGMAARQPEAITELQRRGHRIFHSDEATTLLLEGLGTENPYTVASAHGLMQPFVIEGTPVRSTGGQPLAHAETPFDSLAWDGRLLTAARRIDVAREPYLAAHLVDNIPCMPGAAETELALQLVRKGWPELHPHRLEDVRYHHFVKVFPERLVNLRLEATSLTENAETATVAVRLLTDMHHPDGRLLQRNRVHWSATIQLARSLPNASVADVRVPQHLVPSIIPQYRTGTVLRYTASMRSVTWRGIDQEGVAWARCDAGDRVNLPWAKILPWEVADALAIVPWAKNGVVPVIDRIGQLDLFAPSLVEPLAASAFLVRAEPLQERTDGLLSGAEVRIYDAQGRVVAIGRDLTFREIGRVAAPDLPLDTWVTASSQNGANGEALRLANSIS